VNIPQGSVSVTAGGVKLIENQDYTVDYNLGRVKILNQGILESGTPINVIAGKQLTFQHPDQDVGRRALRLQSEQGPGARWNHHEPVRATVDAER
jgi:hypothetical protein